MRVGIINQERTVRLMKKCSDNCIPCCDYCIHCIHEWSTYGGKEVMGGPIGCKKHLDKEHQDKAFWCSYCDDFTCKNTEEV